MRSQCPLQGLAVEEPRGTLPETDGYVDLPIATTTVDQAWEMAVASVLLLSPLRQIVGQTEHADTSNLTGRFWP